MQSPNILTSLYSWAGYLIFLLVAHPVDRVARIPNEMSEQ